MPASSVAFGEGTTLLFEGSSQSGLNALSVDDTAIVFDFDEANFSSDWGFNLDGARFKIASGHDPIPNISNTSTKRYFKNSRGVENTFPGGRMEFTTQAVTTLTVDTPTKAAGTTTLTLT